MAFAPAVALLNSTNRILPTCAVQCIAKLSSMLLQMPSNETLLCADQQLSHSFELCVSATCTIKEALTSKNITGGMCNLPMRNRTKSISVTAIVGVSLALLAVMLRLLSRIKSRKPGMDDWAILAAMGFVIPLSAMAIILANYGLGKDIWSMPFENITHILYIYYYSEVLYLGSLMMVRVSILCLYLRIFHQGAMRKTTYAILVVNILYSTAFITVSIFQCIPVHAAWTRWDGTVPARCINVNSVAWTSAAVNILLDAVTVVLPLPELARLVLVWEQKMYILVMFSLGFLITVVSILRLTSLVKFANTHNITWDYVPVAYWSSIEVHVGIICAYLSTLPSLFRGKPPETAHNFLPMPPAEATVRKPKSSTSDILPLLTVASGHKHKDIL